MILVVAKIVVKNGDEKNFMPIARELVDETRREAGCICYNLLADVSDACRFTVLEQWESKAALDAHMRTEHFKAFGSKVGGLLAGEIQIDAYQAEKL